MLNYLWAGMIILSIIFGAVNGKMDAVSAAAINGAKDAVTLVISIGGSMILWSGLMKIATSANLVEKIAKPLRPVIMFLFPDIPKKSMAESAITMNICANFLGLGNAATPIGLAAMKELHKLSNKSPVASRSMVMFVVINTASIQLLPMTIATIRAAAGSKTPFDITPAAWIASVIALLAGVLYAKIFERVNKKW